MNMKTRFSQLVRQLQEIEQSLGSRHHQRCYHCQPVVEIHWLTTDPVSGQETYDPPLKELPPCTCGGRTVDNLPAGRTVVSGVAFADQLTPDDLELDDGLPVAELPP
jgi:hypothetical protein